MFDKGDNEEVEVVKSGKITAKFRQNPWIVSTVVLVVLAIVLLLNGSSDFDGITGNVISSAEAGQIVLDFARLENPDAKLSEVNNGSSFYEVVLIIYGKEVIFYLTKDGQNIVSDFISVDLFANQEE